MTAIVRAEHHGHCKSCDYSIHIGDDITWTEDGWIHADCSRDAPPNGRQRPPVQVCETCWLAKPCGCEDPT